MKHTTCVMLLLLFSMFAALLSGCYTSSTEGMASTGGAQQETEPERMDAAAVKTYPLPEENRYVASSYTHYCPASQGGYYFCSGQFLVYHDVNTGTSVTMCPQEGCPHTDSSCAAYMGGTIQNLVEYRDALYAVVKTEEDQLYLVQKDPSSGKLTILGEWIASETSGDQSSWKEVYLHSLSNGKLYYRVYHEVDDMNTGERLSMESTTYVYDLLTKETEPFPLDGFITSGAAGFAVTVEDEVYDEAADTYNFINCELRLYDPSGTSYTVIANQDRDDYVPYSDPNNHYGSKCCYLCGNTLYTLDADTGESTALLTPEEPVVNYWLMDNKIFYITHNEADEVYIYYADLNDCIPVQLQNCGNTEVMVFGVSGEGNDYFAADMQVISKADFYAENYS